MEIAEIRAELERLSGNNPEFYSTVTPGAKPIMGVRVPELRRIAKTIAKSDYQSFLKSNHMDVFELEMLQAFVIGYAKDDVDILLQHFVEFIPQVHDWAVNDALCQTFKIARKYPEETLNMLSAYYDSDDEFQVRVVAVMLLSHFLDDEHIDLVIHVLDRLHTNGNYYAQMGVAWALATVMVKYPQKCMDYFTSSDWKLETWVYNKSIQKMLESYRVLPEMKEQLRKMKIK